MNHIFLLNKLIKYLLSLTIIVLCITDCSKVPVDKTNDSELLGDIYGKIFISKKNESLENTSVFISNNPSYSANTDSNGFFFISRIPAGKYSVIARKEGFADSKVTMVDVAIDSITLLSQHFISNSPSQSVWVGIKIKRVNISNKGNIKGSVMDAHTNKAVTGAWV